MMSWFRRKPSEDELERSVLLAAMQARAKERDTGRLTTAAEMKRFLEDRFKQLGVKPAREERQTSIIGVQALLAESNFINEAVDYRLMNGDAPVPASFRAKMLTAIEKTLADFMRDSER